MSTLYYYINPKTLTNQSTHNLPQFWHPRVVKSSNLTFGGYLAGTTPVLSVRSSLFVLCMYCFGHVRTVWLTIDFSASSVFFGSMCGWKKCVKIRVMLFKHWKLLFKIHYQTPPYFLDFLCFVCFVFCVCMRERGWD